MSRSEITKARDRERLAAALDMRRRSTAGSGGTNQSQAANGGGKEDGVRSTKGRQEPAWIGRGVRRETATTPRVEAPPPSAVPPQKIGRNDGIGPVPGDPHTKE
jgi:hypothetical protein